MIPMGPVYNGYDFDRNSSGEAWGSQEQLGWGRLGIWGWKKEGIRDRGEGVGNAGLCSRWAATDSPSPPVGGHSSQVPLLRDTDSSVTSGENQL